MIRVRNAALALLLVAVIPHAAVIANQQTPARVQAVAVKVTILSTMLSGNPERGIGEWGFAGLLEVDGQRLLIDTGARPETVLHNAQELGIDLSSITDVVLTHNHSDHVGGLVTLRRELVKRNPQALRRAHVAPDIFRSRQDSNGQDRNGLLPARAAYEAAGGSFVEHAAPTELLPGVWFTGPVPRRNPERNWGTNLRLQTPSGFIEDNIPEDSSVVVDTPAGLIVITGCGHAGVVNISEYARSFRDSAPIHAIVGGLHLFEASDDHLTWTGNKLREFGVACLHLFEASDDHLTWTGNKLREFGVAHLLGAHCTGLEAVYRLRQVLGLARPTAVVGAVGASFTLGKGIDPLGLAR